MELGGRYRFKMKPNQEFHLYHFTDWHLLNKACAEKHIDERVERVRRDPLCGVIGTGDLIEGIDYRDIRWDAEVFPDGIDVRHLDDFARFSMDYLGAKLDPIKSKILGLGLGNHEHVLLSRTRSWHVWYDLLRSLGRTPYRIADETCRAQDLSAKKRYEKLTADVRSARQWAPGCANLGADLGLLDLVFDVKGKGEYVYRVCTHHGYGGARSAGTVINQIVHFLNFADAHITLLGHQHQPGEYTVNTLGADEKLSRLRSHRRLGVVGSTYLATYQNGVSSYAGRKGHRPTLLGNPIISIKPEKGEFSVSWN